MSTIEIIITSVFGVLMFAVIVVAIISFVQDFRGNSEDGNSSESNDISE